MSERVSERAASERTKEMWAYKIKLYIVSSKCLLNPIFIYMPYSTYLLAYFIYYLLINDIFITLLNE